MAMLLSIGLVVRPYRRGDGRANALRVSRRAAQARRRQGQPPPQAQPPPQPAAIAWSAPAAGWAAALICTLPNDSKRSIIRLDNCTILAKTETL